MQYSRAASSEAAAVKPKKGETDVTTITNESSSSDEGPPPIVWTTHRLNQEQIVKVDAIFHKILWLDMFETSMLSALINERLGLKLTLKQQKALQRQMDARAAVRQGSQDSSGAKSAAAEEEVEAGPALVDLKLTGFDAKAKIKVIKEVRAVVEGLGLKEAKELVEGAPKVIMKGIKPEQAEELKQRLEAVGAQVEVVS
jgi:large subunit ribosomal protein L7/L12